MKWLLSHMCNFISAIFFACIGYFSPIKGIIHVMIFAIVVDLASGILAARKRGEGIKSHKLWRTIYKLVFALAVVMLTFALDKEIGFITTHTSVAWLIIGFEIWSILENAGQLTNHPIFQILRKFMEDKVKTSTGINLKEMEDQK